MRLKTVLLPFIAFGLAGLGSVFAARVAATAVETRSVIAVQETLMDRGHSWVSVIGDGLQIVLEGEAPSEAIRFRARSVAGEIVDSSRVIDSMSVRATEQIAPPDFAVEILRNESGVSLVGLIPATSDREALTSEIAEAANGAPVTDLLEVADYPIPDGWQDALDYAVQSLAALPQSQISVEAGFVDITAISSGTTQQRQIETSLSRDAPDGVRLALAISAPRPVITPYTVRFVMDDEGTRFDACAADTEETQSQIISAAIEAGAAGQISCPLALGVPSRTWGDAVAQGIDAIANLGGGSLTISDTYITILALEGTAPATFEDVIGELTNDLPDVFALDSTLPEPEVQTAVGPPRFSATQSPEGEVQLRGLVSDALMNTLAENFAIAKFGTADLTMRTRLSDSLPSGWSVRVLAAIEALSLLSNGAVIVEPDVLTVRGNTGDPDASATISRLMIDKLGQSAEFIMDVTYVEALDPIAGLPSPEECVAQIFAVTADRKITFDPSSTELSASAQPILDDIANILQRCPDLEIEIAGYTDSQGRDVMNRELSQARADSVLTALRSRRVPVGRFRAVGYGEEDPIADNDTEDGREANRRIEFRLIEREPVVEEPTLLEETEVAPETIEEDTGEDTGAETDDE